MTLVGFVLTYPQGPSTHAARTAIDRSVLVFDIFGKNFSVAASAAKIVRDLCPKVDFLRGQSRVSLGFSDTTQNAANFEGLDEQPLADDRFSMANINNSAAGKTGLYSIEGADQDFFDMALSVDFWADFDMLWPSTNLLPENWTVA
jgi:hypothetical protein